MFHYFDQFLAAYEVSLEKEDGFFRLIIKEVVERYLDCGNPKGWFARIRGFCPSCHAKRVEEWGEWMPEELLLDVPHFKVVFTIPKMLRLFFRYNRRMRIIAFITDYAVVDRIINHLKLTFVAERPPPPHVAYQKLLMAAESSADYFSLFFDDPGGEVRLISGHSKLPSSFLASPEQFSTGFGIPWAAIYELPRTTGGANGHKKARSAGAAKNEIIIYQIRG